MFGNSIYGKMVDMSQMSLGTSILRKRVIADNIANVDTPNFKRHQVAFESELNRAIDSEKAEFVPTKVSDFRHIPFHRVRNFRDVEPLVQIEYDSNIRNDKNNVDIEKEIADEVKNTMFYSAVTTMIGNNFKRLKSVLA